jgi:hypothetical protein
MNDRDKPSPDEILRPIRRASMSGSTAPETQIDADGRIGSNLLRQDLCRNRRPGINH